MEAPPDASALLTQLKIPDRGFDTVVIGEPQRAFYGNQYALTFPVFTHWRPAVGTLTSTPSLPTAMTSWPATVSLSKPALTPPSSPSGRPKSRPVRPRLSPASGHVASSSG